MQEVAMLVNGNSQEGVRSYRSSSMLISRCKTAKKRALFEHSRTVQLQDTPAIITEGTFYDSFLPPLPVKNAYHQLSRCIQFSPM